MYALMKIPITVTVLVLRRRLKFILSNSLKHCRFFCTDLMVNTAVQILSIINITNVSTEGEFLQLSVHPFDLSFQKDGIIAQLQKISSKRLVKLSDKPHHLLKT